MFAHFKNVNRSYLRRVNPTVWVLWHWVVIWHKDEAIFASQPHRILACSITT